MNISRRAFFRLLGGVSAVALSSRIPTNQKHIDASDSGLLPLSSDETYYVIQDGESIEVGIGKWNASPSEIQRMAT